MEGKQKGQSWLLIKMGLIYNDVGRVRKSVNLTS